jgi:lipopolysaccharide export system protein LptA
MKRALIILAMVSAAVLSPAPAQTVDTTAAVTESKTPRDVDIEADSMQVFDDQKKVIFSGHVRGKRGTVTLNSNELTVLYVETTDSAGEKKTEVTHLDAVGSVKIVTARQTVTGEWAKMDVKANKVTVGGNVKVVQGTTVISGEKLFVDLDRNVSEMTGGRVKGSFVPAQ